MTRAQIAKKNKWYLSCKVNLFKIVFMTHTSYDFWDGLFIKTIPKVQNFR